MVKLNEKEQKELKIGELFPPISEPYLSQWKQANDKEKVRLQRLWARQKGV